MPGEPIRSCIACRQRRPQAELLRLSWDGTEVVVETSPRQRSGRGAYLCANMPCWALADRRGLVARALRLPGAAVDRDALQRALAGMITSSPRPPGRVPTAPPA